MSLTAELVGQTPQRFASVLTLPPTLVATGTTSRRTATTSPASPHRPSPTTRPSSYSPVDRMPSWATAGERRWSLVADLDSTDDLVVCLATGADARTGRRCGHERRSGTKILASQSAAQRAHSFAGSPRLLSACSLSCPQPVLARRCHETGEGSGVFEREWSKATVRWDCAKGHGEIVRKLDEQF